MAVVFALLAALSNAVSVATQHIASTAAPRRSSGWRLVAVPVPQSAVAVRLGGPGGSVPVPGARPARWPGLGRAAAPGHRAGVRARAAPVLDSPVHPPDHLGRRRPDLRWAWPCSSSPGNLEAAIPPRRVSTGSWPRLACGAGAARPGRRGAMGIPGPARGPVRLGGGAHLGARGDDHQGHDGHAHPVRRGRDVHPLAGVRPGRGRCGRHLSCSRWRCTSGRCGSPSRSW